MGNRERGNVFTYQGMGNGEQGTTFTYGHSRAMFHCTVLVNKSGLPTERQLLFLDTATPCPRPSVSCPLTSAFCLLPSAFCLLPSAFCSLPSAFCLLPSASYLLV